MSSVYDDDGMCLWKLLLTCVFEIQDVSIEILLFFKIAQFQLKHPVELCILRNDIFFLLIFRTSTFNYSQEDLPPSASNTSNRGQQQGGGGQHLRAPTRQDYNIGNNSGSNNAGGLRTPSEKPSGEKLITPGSPMESIRRRYPTCKEFSRNFLNLQNLDKFWHIFKKYFNFSIFSCWTN